jgi:hypothetical protein
VKELANAWRDSFLVGHHALPGFPQTVDAELDNVATLEILRRLKPGADALRVPVEITSPACSDINRLT